MPPGMRTLVEVGVGPEGEDMLRGPLSFRCGAIRRGNGPGGWERVPATRTFDASPDRAMNAGLHALTDPRDVSARVRTLPDPDRRAVPEAIPVVRRGPSRTHRPGRGPSGRRRAARGR